MPDNSTKKFIDLLTAFPFGASSAVAPLLLPKNQMAWGINSTFRGGYATDRPPVIKRTLDFGGSMIIQNAVRKGFFQGAGVYRPDFGSSQIIAQISGRLFTFTENGAVWTVAEITIPGDPNSATQSQVWMWQAEKWMIISDGSGALPIFYDGVSSRRSYGPSYTIVAAGGILATVPATVPAVGDTVELTLSSAYTGPFNIPVRFNGAVYQPSEQAAGSTYDAILTNISATPGATVPIGSQLVVRPARVGQTSVATSVVFVAPGYSKITAEFASPHNLVALSYQVLLSGTGLSASITGRPWYVSSIISPTKAELTSAPPIGSPPVPAGTLVSKTTADPDVVIGDTDAPFVVPAVGSTVAVTLGAPYSGADGQSVWIGDDQYTISAPPPVGQSTTLYLINLTDTAGVAYANLPDLTITSIPEIPACRMGAYGLGQTWFSSVDGLSFGVSDIVGGSSGSPANNYRDAVLKTVDIETMGMFRLPNAGEIITSMTFTATLDAALGQGPLQVGVASGMFSVRAPFTLLDWADLVDSNAGPILTKSLIGFGPVGQNSTVLANSDTIFRSYEGVGSLVLARRDFSDIAGNTPISREVSRALDADRKDLLSFSSAIVFDNRLRMTCAPQVSGQGVFHLGEVALNYDLISSLRGKVPPVWEGLWTGVNIMQFVQGLFGTVSRAFAFTFNLTDSQIELYELLPTGNDHFDNGDTRIKWVLETPVLFNQEVKPLPDLARLTDGEMYLSDVNGRVDVTVLYRPLFYPCWRPWHTFAVCSNMSASNAKQQAISPLGFGEPDPRDCDPINDRPFRESNGFQIRLEITGHCKIWGVKVLGYLVPVQAFEKLAGTCNLDDPECPALNCDAPNDYEIYSLDGIPPTPLPPAPSPIPPVAQPYTNDEVYYDVECAEGTTLTFTP